MTKEKNGSIFWHWQTGGLLAAFFCIRLISFLVAGHFVFQTIISFSLLMLLAGLYFKKPVYAWYLVLGELFLGSSGNFFSFAGFSIRTVFVGTLLLLWTAEQLFHKRLMRAITIDKTVLLLYSLFGSFLLFSFGRALYLGNPIHLILADLTPFFFLPLLFPFAQAIKQVELQRFGTRLAIVYILGTAIFMICTFILFSSGIEQLHDPFYKWFRDLNGGKITDLGNNFFRIVENSHLLLVPFMLFLSALLMRRERHHLMWYLLLGLLGMTLAINFSRIYMLAYLVGLFILILKHHIGRWLAISLFGISIFVLSLVSLSFVASSGETLGLDLIGIRTASIARPASEESAAYRLLMLPHIIAMIEEQPLLGYGLGAQVTFFDPEKNEMITNSQFDWGYLELFVEFGLFGALLFLSLFAAVFFKLIGHILAAPDYHDIHVGLLASLVAFGVMNLTSPALFHVFGILFLMYLSVAAIQPYNHLPHIVRHIYTIFHLEAPPLTIEKK